MSFVSLREEIKGLQDAERAKNLSWFFKTGPGEYGEGDKFLGIKMGPQRELAKKFKELNFTDIERLLAGKFHEERMIGLLILVYKYKAGDESNRGKIYRFYLKNWKSVNNWDLVDVTVPHVVGDYLLNHDCHVLYEFARSNNLWKKRIAVLATFPFIKQKKFADSLKIAEILLNDTHDLIHKAVGWMLREIGKVDLPMEETFLKKHYQQMPRTMLRYAIEKFPEQKRQKYLKGTV